MASSGIVNSVSFTPSGAGTLIVTCTFSGQRTLGSDWGAGAFYKPFFTQSGNTIYGDSQAMSTSRIAYTSRFQFAVAAGSSVQCGLFGGVTGASACSFWDTQVTAELIKR